MNFLKFLLSNETHLVKSVNIFSVASQVVLLSPLLYNSLFFCPMISFWQAYNPKTTFIVWAMMDLYRKQCYVEEETENSGERGEIETEA